MSASPFELLRAGEVLLGDLMSVKRGEEVVITADTSSDAIVAQAIFAAAERLGARALISTGPKLPYQGLLADPYISRSQAQVVRECDVWIDLTFPYFAGSHLHDETMKAGRVRYMLAGDVDAGSFHRLFGQVDFDAYFDAMAQFDALFKPGKRCRITTRTGTDVTFTLAKSGLTKPRHADKPGMYLVPGTCSIAPDVPTVKGTIVVSHSFHEFYEPLASPVTFEVDGKIRRMTGGGASRFPLERALLRAGGGEYGGVIHFAYGMHPAARVTGTCFIEDIRAMGSNAVGLGIPWWEPGGGENHPDCVLTEQSVWVDNEQLIADGVVIAPQSFAECVARLAPSWQRH